MNDRYYVAVSTRVRLPNNTRKHYLARLTTAPDCLKLSWQVKETNSITTTDSVSLATARKYGLQTFPNKQMLKALRKGIGEYLRKNKMRSKDAFCKYFINYISNKSEDFGLAQNAVVDYAEEIIGEIKCEA